ncbi:MAG: GNAT family N-acetyltransferase [Planctomycetota bacterium]|nr:GNAT family N-acetyltransferase [Planctomycetota bacterium]
MGGTLVFRPIDLERHAHVCIDFRRDSFVVSFGDDARFVEFAKEDGSGYLELLRERMAAFPEGHVHAWLGDEIVGQIECRKHDGDPPKGYVNLFYLVPERRNGGMGAQLDAYVCELFRSFGADHLRLSVSPTNAQAWRFYAKQGWVDLGPRDDGSASNLLEKRLDT